MKKTFIIFAIFFSFNFLVMSPLVSARQTSMSTYYPSASGNYTQLILSNGGTNAPNENGGTGGCFCAQNSTNQNGINPGTNNCDTGEPVCSSTVTSNCVTYTNAGTIIADPSTGYLEICKNDGTVASYPGSCFTRFGNTITMPPCPTNYSEPLTSQTSNTLVNGGSTVYTWSCCFTGQGISSQASITQSGCFSTYGTATTPPALCSSVSPNAYDIGCDPPIVDTTGLGATTYKRNCCFNAGSSGSLTPSTTNCS